MKPSQVKPTKHAVKPQTARAKVSASTNPIQQHTNQSRGLLYALLSIPAGIVAWCAIWQLGFMASLVAFGIGWFALYLFVLGAKSESASRGVKLALAGIIVAGIVLSFMSGIALDVQKSVSEVTHWGFWQVITTGRFWTFVGEVLRSGETWSSYSKDAAFAAVFGALGSYSIIKSLLTTK